jgi:hypothetical protein
MVSVVVLLSVWSSFILIGTVFYAYYDNYNWNKGVFYAVNVGFNIGWNWTVDESQDSEVFSIFYLLIGFFLLTLAIVYIGEVAIEKRSKWLASYMSSRMDTRLREQGLMAPAGCNEDAHAFASTHYVTISFTLALFLWVLFGTAWSCFSVGWTFVDGLYFALSSLTAGGMKSLPDDSPDWFYGFTGVYAAIGIPLMALSVGLIAAAIILHASYATIFDSLLQTVSKTDLKLLRSIEERAGTTTPSSASVDNGNSKVSGSRNNIHSSSMLIQGQKVDVFAYTVLMSMRMNLLDECMLEEIMRRYKEEMGGQDDNVKQASNVTATV